MGIRTRGSRRELATGLEATSDGTASVLALEGGAFGFWAALREVYPETSEQWSWVHPGLSSRTGKIATVLGKLPKRMKPRAKMMLHEIMSAPDRRSPREEMDHFVEKFEARYPRVGSCPTKDAEDLFTLYDFLLYTGDICDPPMPLSRASPQSMPARGRRKGLALGTLAFKLILAAQDRWRRVNGPHLVALVRAGARFKEEIAQLSPRPGEKQSIRLDDTPAGIATTPASIRRT